MAKNGWPLSLLNHPVPSTPLQQQHFFKMCPHPRCCEKCGSFPQAGLSAARPLRARASSPSWVRPGFSSTQGGLLPRATVDGKPGRRGLKAQEPTGTCKARSTLGLGTGCCPGLRLCAHLTVHLGKVPLIQAVPPQSAMAEKVTVRFNSVLCCCSARWHGAPLQSLDTDGGAGS